jgi:hypothetical protein
MGQRMKTPLAGVSGREWSLLIGTVVVGASGAIASQTGARDAMFTVTKLAQAGRYSVAFDEKISQAELVSATLIGHASNDPGVVTTDGGFGSTFECNNSPSTGTTQVQFTQTNGTDANIASGNSFRLVFLARAAGV